MRRHSGRCSSSMWRRPPLSTSDARERATDFDRWIAAEFAESGAFTAFVLLVEIAETKVTPLCSTYFNVIGDEIDWGEITVLFAGAGGEWDGATFFPVTASAPGRVATRTTRR